MSVACGAHTTSSRGAGFAGTPVEVACAPFECILGAPSGVVFAVEVEELGRINESSPEDPAFPFVLTAGERLSFTANTIIGDPDCDRRGRIDQG